MKVDLDRLMDERNLSALLITGPAQQNPSMYYMTGGGHMTHAEGRKGRRVAEHVGHLRVGMNWANRKGLLPRKVEFDMPTTGKARARAVTLEEFERMLGATSRSGRGTPKSGSDT